MLPGRARLRGLQSRRAVPNTSKISARVSRYNVIAADRHRATRVHFVSCALSSGLAICSLQTRRASRLMPLFQALVAAAWRLPPELMKRCPSHENASETSPLRSPRHRRKLRAVAREVSRSSMAPTSASGSFNCRMRRAIVSAVIKQLGRAACASLSSRATGPGQRSKCGRNRRPSAYQYRRASACSRMWLRHRQSRSCTLAFQPGQGDAFDERALGEEEENDHWNRKHGRRRHQQAPFGAVLSEVEP